MKKINNWALVLIMILTAGLTLTSCDKDQMQASELHGIWEGDFHMEYNGRRASNTILEFYQDGISNHGTGKQYDYYGSGRYTHMYFRFNWAINDGVITLTYPMNPELNETIYDYKMTSREFYGYFKKSGTYFCLDKRSSSFSWDDYTEYDYY